MSKYSTLYIRSCSRNSSFSRSVSGRSSFDAHSSIDEEGSAYSRDGRISRGSFQASISRDESVDEYLRAESHQVQLVGGQGVGKTALLHKLASTDDGNSQGDNCMKYQIARKSFFKKVILSAVFAYYWKGLSASLFLQKHTGRKG